MIRLKYNSKWPILSRSNKREIRYISIPYAHKWASGCSKGKQNVTWWRACPEGGKDPVEYADFCFLLSKRQTIIHRAGYIKTSKIVFWYRIARCRSPPYCALRKTLYIKTVNENAGQLLCLGLGASCFQNDTTWSLPWVQTCLAEV